MESFINTWAQFIEPVQTLYTYITQCFINMTCKYSSKSGRVYKGKCSIRGGFM